MVPSRFFLVPRKRVALLWGVSKELDDFRIDQGHFFLLFLDTRDIIAPDSHQSQILKVKFVQLVHEVLTLVVATDTDPIAPSRLDFRQPLEIFQSHLAKTMDGIEVRLINAVVVGEVVVVHAQDSIGSFQ